MPHPHALADLLEEFDKVQQAVSTKQAELKTAISAGSPASDIGTVLNDMMALMEIASTALRRVADQARASGATRVAEGLESGRRADPSAPFS